MKLLQLIWFFPKKYYYAMLSPHAQFKRLIQAIKRKHPLCYKGFCTLLKNRFFVMSRPEHLRGFSISVGEGKEIQAFFGEGGPSVFLNDILKKKIIEKREFQNSYYGPGMH